MFEDDVMSVMAQNPNAMTLERVICEFAGFLDCHYQSPYPWSGAYENCLDKEDAEFLQLVEKLSKDCLFPVSDGLQFESLGGIKDMSPDVVVKVNGGERPVCDYDGFIVANVPEGDIISFKGLEGLYCLDSETLEVVRMFDSYHQMIQLQLSLGLVGIYGITSAQFISFVKERNIEETGLLSMLAEEIVLFEGKEKELVE
jgi:hypothetical protein